LDDGIGGRVELAATFEEGELDDEQILKSFRSELFNELSSRFGRTTCDRFTIKKFEFEIFC
jgi:hypothetical protein